LHPTTGQEHSVDHHIKASLATRRDLGAAGRSLAAAFDDDPVWRWLVGDRKSFSWRTSQLMRSITSMHLDTNSVWISPDAQAVGVWAPPRRYRTTTRQFLSVAHRFVPAAGIGGLKRFAAIGAIDNLHPDEPHWYLAVLGTDPAHQGRGLGGAVMAPAMARADRDGVGCYLESSKEDNIAFYRRHGFEVTGTHDIDDGRGPRLWLMWRQPQPPASAH
jgi:ribosomal protein S18 acetylase RimI-like enzyme